MTAIAFGLIIAIILIKYKPIYKVAISGNEVGYVNNTEALMESVKENILEQETNVDAIDIKVMPEYELKLVDRTLKTNEQEIAKSIQENTQITYKYYEIALNHEEVDKVSGLEEAQKLIEEIKEENPEKELDLSMVEKYTNSKEEATTTQIELAKTNVQDKVTTQIEQEEKEKEEQERINSLPNINGIQLAVKPVSGTITSRYGVSSSLRRSTHTGLDIAAPTGTSIQAVADGLVTSASYSGAYGNLVKISHGNGIETWYAHTSTMYVQSGQNIKAGETIAAVGSTGNSTGPHLHLEIRINGNHVNPQNYLYK